MIDIISNLGRFRTPVSSTAGDGPTQKERPEMMDHEICVKIARRTGLRRGAFENYREEGPPGIKGRVNSGGREVKASDRAQLSLRKRQITTSPVLEKLPLLIILVMSNVLLLDLGRRRTH
ncbi:MULTISPECIES: hypothetical protein [unclassified Rhizobium]|uniref:hypothetical protein n=1 Tax=unclassified Rhizobium TaxID=2613769 RepID=UPI0013041E67